MKYIILLFSFILLAGCGVRKTNKTETKAKNSTTVSATAEQTVESTTETVKKTEVNKNINGTSQSFKNEDTEVTADSIDYNASTGSIKAKGNVKFKQRKQAKKADTLSDKTTETTTAAARVDVKADAKTATMAKQESERLELNKQTHRNNVYAGALIALIIVIGIIVAWKKLS